MQSWETLIIPGLMVIVSSLITFFLTRDKNKAEVKKITADRESIATDVYQKVIDTLREQSRQDKEEIERLKALDKIRVRQNLECEQKHTATSIEVKLLRKYVYDHNIQIQKFSIVVLDDDKYERDAFKKKFDQLSITNVAAFDKIKPAMDYILKHEPEILVLDYFVGADTIDDLMHRIVAQEDYTPKVIVISGMDEEKFNKLPYKVWVWEFFNKNDDYLNKAVNKVLEYIEQTIT